MAPKLNDLSSAALSAAMRGGTQAWSEHGSAERHVRYKEPVPSQSRRLCRCGCRRRASHLGMANGVALIQACELRVARWIKEGR